MVIRLLILFVKQKTAYELRISDWSSDVFSSDLFARARGSRERYVQPSDGSTDGLARDRALITDTIGSIPAERDEPDRHHPPVSRAERNFAIRSATRLWRRIRRSRTSSLPPASASLSSKRATATGPSRR